LKRKHIDLLTADLYKPYSSEKSFARTSASPIVALRAFVDHDLHALNKRTPAVFTSFLFPIPQWWPSSHSSQKLSVLFETDWWRILYPNIISIV
jgi:hypothetical protein